MSLPEIRALLKAIQRPDADCSPVNTLLDETHEKRQPR